MLFTYFPDPIFSDDSDASDDCSSSGSSSTSTSDSSDPKAYVSQSQDTQTTTPRAGVPPVTTPPDSSSDPYTNLRQTQDAIGWDHFLRGKLARGWTHLQYVYASKHSLLDASKHWHTWLIRYMATQSFQIWDSRNKARHGSDSTSSTKSELAQVHRDITALYELRDQVLPQDRDLFCASLDVHLTRPLAALRGWLAINRDLIRFSVRTANLQAKSGTKPISTFFSSIRRCKGPIRTKKQSPRPHRFFRPSRVTRFFTRQPRPPKTTPSAPAPTPPSGSPSHTPHSTPSPPRRPRQR